MADALSNAVSGLLSFQRALATTSHNISNVSTDGYSRQSAQIGAQDPSFIGGYYIGNGSQINAVQRAYDQFLTVELRDTTSTHARFDRLTELAGHIDDVLADPVGGISPILHEFFAAVQDVADDPTSTTARYNLINVANTFTSRFDNIDTRFQQLQESTTTDIRTTVDEINTLVTNIRDINATLANQPVQDNLNQQSADLLDERDRLMQQLAEKVNISVINERENNLSIFIGNGQTILTGTQAFELEAVPNTSDPRQDIIVYRGVSQINDITAALTGGGELGAMLEFRDTILEDTRNDLGRVAIALAASFNDQHRAGMDLNGNLGTDFFSFSTPSVTPFSNNVGTATIDVAISDVTALTRFDYNLEYFDDGINPPSWRLVSDSGSASAAVPDLSPGADTVLNFEGLTVTIDGPANAANNGDRFRIKPTLDGAGSLEVLISDPLLIAAAAPIRTEASLNNLGTSAITPGEVIDEANPALLNPVTITFNNPPTTFDVTDTVTAATTTLAFTNGVTVDFNGWRATLSGIPQAGDVLNIQPNLGGQGDNRNALALGNLQVTGILDGGKSDYQQAFSNLVGRVGTLTAAFDNQRVANEALMFQARDRRDSKTAVNLDEEAADLIKFQQAYEAAARVIGSVQVMFDSLIAATR